MWLSGCARVYWGRVRFVLLSLKDPFWVFSLSQRGYFLQREAIWLVLHQIIALSIHHWILNICTHIFLCHYERDVLLNHNISEPAEFKKDILCIILCLYFYYRGSTEIQKLIFLIIVPYSVNEMLDLKYLYRFCNCFYEQGNTLDRFVKPHGYTLIFARSTECRRKNSSLPSVNSDYVFLIYIHPCLIFFK